MREERASLESKDEAGSSQHRSLTIDLSMSIPVAMNQQQASGALMQTFSKTYLSDVPSPRKIHHHRAQTTLAAPNRVETSPNRSVSRNEN